MTSEDDVEDEDLPDNAVLLRQIPGVTIGSGLDKDAKAYPVIAVTFTGVNVTTSKPQKVSVIFHSGIELVLVRDLFAAHEEQHERFDR
jgi:hypothetical protein